MEAARHARIKEVFLAVQALPPAQRQAVLDRECAGDVELRQEVESLLAHHHHESLLAQPPGTGAPPRVARITFDGEATAKWNEEQRHLLHQRIRLWALALHLIVLIVVVRAFAFFEGASTLSAGALLGLAGGSLALLGLGLRTVLLRAPALEQLRRYEAALTAAAAVAIFSWTLTWLTRGATLALPAQEELAGFFRSVYWSVSPGHGAYVRLPPSLISFPVANYWGAMGGLYGMIVPNPPRRGAVMVGAMVLAPWATLLAAAVVSPALRPYLAGNLLTCLLIIGPFSAMSLYVSLRFQSLRRAVFEARQAGQYRLVRLLGKGSMGEVYLAQHWLLRRPCAVKLIRPERAGREDWRLRFEREVQAMAQLTHPHTAEVYDFGRTEDDAFFYAMEYLPGTTLEALVRAHGPLPPGRAVYLLLQVCGALAEAHRKGLVHRDVKPGNIFVSERGGQQDFIKLLDFGLVHGLGEELAAGAPLPGSAAPGAGPHLTQAGQLMGTPSFMAPEQIRGEPPDARSDIYSLGGVACYLLTGRPPFEGETLEELFAAHLTAPVPRLREWNPGLPAELEAVIERCLAKERGARFQSVEEVATALGAARGDSPWDSAQAEAWWRQHTASLEPAAKNQEG